MSLPSLYVAGCGTLGLGLLSLWHDGGGKIVGAYNRGAGGRERAKKRIGIVADAAASAAAGEAELVLVTVNDDSIGEVGAALAPHLKTSSVVAHTSGALPASALGAQPCPRGSLHPPLALSSPDEVLARLPGARFAVEGEPVAVQMLEACVKALDGTSFVLRAEDKTRYHAAVVLASNLVVALVSVARGQMALPEELLLDLAESAIAQAQARGLEGGLTGPVARGDVETVRRHLEVLGPEAQTIYRELSRAALSLAQQRGLDVHRGQALLQLLR